VIRPVDVLFELVHTRGGADVEVLATWMQHYEPLPGGIYEAQACDVDMAAPAIAFETGDQLLWRITGTNASAMQSFIPNGDGVRAKGRIPSVTLPE
jgi:hypothetical protein